MTSQPRRLYRRIHLLPSLLTIGNFACGFFSIVFCLNSLFFATRAQTIENPTANREVAAAAAQAGPAYDSKVREHDLSVSTAEGSSARAYALLHWACFIVFIGMLFDVLDGRVARLMGAASSFGRELDSLADITTFAIAPPIIVNSLWISVMPVTSAWWGQVLIFGGIFAACGMLRLARYNIEAGTSDKNIFSGLPSPAAAGCVVTAVLVAYGDYPLIEAFCRRLDILIGPGMNAFQVKVNLLALFLIIPGLLMVSTVPYAHVSNRYLSGKKSFALLVLAVILLAMIWSEPRITLFVIFNGYMATGLFFALRQRWRDRKRRCPFAAGEADGRDEDGDGMDAEDEKEMLESRERP